MGGVSRVCKSFAIYAELTEKLVLPQTVSLWRLGLSNFLRQNTTSKQTLMKSGFEQSPPKGPRRMPRNRPESPSWKKNNCPNYMTNPTLDEIKHAIKSISPVQTPISFATVSRRWSSLPPQGTCHRHNSHGSIVFHYFCC